MNGIVTGKTEPAENVLREVSQALVISCVRQHELAEDAATARQQCQEANAALEAALDRERHITEILQRPLTVEVPEGAFPGLPVATIYEAALQEALVGGDFFDAFVLREGQVALAIADASGKGLSAAVRALQVKDVLRAFTREYPFSAASIVARLNDFVCDTQHFDEQGGAGFVCLALAILDPKTGEGAIVSAGCEPPLIVRAGGTTEVIQCFGLPLGVQEHELYAVMPLHLAPGDTLVLVTDGITEARNGDEFLGYEGMVTLVQQSLAAIPFSNEASSLRVAGKAILEGARAFGAGVLRDDACLLLARRD